MLRRGDPTARLLFLVTSLWWTNMLLVAALEPPQSRYTFYFDELVVVVAMALVARALSAVKPETSSTEPTSHSIR